ncbi:MAG: nitroreductase family protein [Candidatus Faecivicinus sp.]
MNEVLKAIQDRRSTRGFNDVQLTEAQLQALIDAALASPTARNTQMWHFSVVQNRELLDEFSRDAAALIAATLPEGSRGRFEDKDFHLFYHAPTVIFISRPKECSNRFVEVDCGIACENIALAAQGLGLGSVIVGMPMDVFLSDKGAYYNKAFGIPEGYGFSIGIVVGNNTVTKEAHPIGEGKVNIVR